METLHPRQAAILRAVADYEPISASALAELDELASIGAGNIRTAIFRLQSGALIQGERNSETPFTARPLSVTTKGKRLLRQHEDADPARTAVPRTMNMHTTWDGRWQNAPARPGALDAFTLPSLRGDDRVPHQRPVSLPSPDARTK